MKSVFQQCCDKIKNPKHREWFEEFAEGCEEDFTNIKECVEWLIYTAGLVMNEEMFNEEIRTLKDVKKWRSYLNRIIKIVEDVSKK